MSGPRMRRLAWTPRDDDAIARAARDHDKELQRRRSVREFCDRPVSRAVIEDLIRAAGSAPSGANLQPWHFVAVGDADTKRRIRAAAEEEERAFYRGRAPDAWLRVLRSLGTDEHKPFLEIAPWLIAIFAERHGDDGNRNYYVQESVGIATGLLIGAVHRAGLACLTHTPSPMRFLSEILERPDNERAYLLLVVGHPADGVQVPDIERKPLAKIATFV